MECYQIFPNQFKFFLKVPYLRNCFFASFILIDKLLQKLTFLENLSSAYFESGLTKRLYIIEIIFQDYIRPNLQKNEENYRKCWK